MGRRWLLFDLVGDLRTILRMFFDVRFRLAWSTRVIVLVLVPLTLLVDWWLPFAAVPIVGPLVCHFVILILSFIVFKALSREARRYVETKGSSS